MEGKNAPPALTMRSAVARNKKSTKERRQWMFLKKSLKNYVAIKETINSVFNDLLTLLSNIL